VLLMRSENDIFVEYKAAEGEVKEALYLELHKALIAHALAVCWLQLQEYRPDIASYCAYKALSKLNRFRGDAKLSTWYHRIVLNACTSKLRDRLKLREQSLDDLSPAEQGELAENPDAQISAKVQVAQLMDKLSPEDRQFIEWRLADVPDVEIAKRTNMTREGVRCRWFRIRKRILRHLR
jgi:RNA polymerase sigma-70 factor (ECF subfamily)